MSGHRTSDLRLQTADFGLQFSTPGARPGRRGLVMGQFHFILLILLARPSSRDAEYFSRVRDLL
jgi:hypothetical protein